MCLHKGLVGVRRRTNGRVRVIGSAEGDGGKPLSEVALHRVAPAVERFDGRDDVPTAAGPPLDLTADSGVVAKKGAMHAPRHVPRNVREAGRVHEVILDVICQGFQAVEEMYCCGIDSDVDIGKRRCDFGHLPPESGIVQVKFRGAVPVPVSDAVQHEIGVGVPPHARADDDLPWREVRSKGRQFVDIGDAVIREIKKAHVDAGDEGRNPLDDVGPKLLALESMAAIPPGQTGRRSGEGVLK